MRSPNTHPHSAQRPLRGRAHPGSTALLLGLILTPVLTASALPDLKLLEVAAQAVTTDCKTLARTGRVTARIANQGSDSAPAGAQVLFFEDSNANGRFDAANDRTLGTAALPALASGGEAVVSLDLADTARFLGDLIYALADSLNGTSESNENNNLAHSGLTCEYQPTAGAFAPRLEWSWTHSAIHPDSLNVMMTPSVIDLNGDGVPEVVFGSTPSTGGGYVETGILRALDGSDGTELFSVTDPDLAISTTASIATGDIDGDGRPEIIASDNSGFRLIAFEQDGSFKWRSPNLEFVYWGAPAIADLDADGSPEIVLGRNVLNADGTLRWTGSAGRGSQGVTGAISLVADIDMDGKPEVIAGNTAYTSDGAVLWQAAVPDGHNAIGNFDGDAFPEIVLVSGGAVWVLEHTGDVKWGPVAIPGGGLGGPPTVADYDNDGSPEVGVAGANRYAVFETDGTLKWQVATQDGSSNVTGSSVFDFEGDGIAEVVYRDELYLRVYRGSDGFVLFQTPMSSCTWHEYVLVADVDADGNAEIVAVANNNCGFGPQRGVYVFGDAGDAWVSTRAIWNQHSYHISNINDDGSVPKIEPNGWQTFNNYRQNVQTQGSPLAAPDLTASWIRTDPRPCPDGVDIVARIGNAGANVAPTGIRVAFYTDSGSLLGVVPTTHSLLPGQYEDVHLTLQPSPEALMTLCVVADDDGSGRGVANECDELNNTCCARLSVACRCIEDLVARAKSGKVQLVWSPVGAAAYQVLRSTTPGGPYVPVGATSSTFATFLDPNVVNGTTYFYQVRALNDAGEAVCLSNEASAQPSPRAR